MFEFRIKLAFRYLSKINIKGDRYNFVTFDQGELPRLYCSSGQCHFFTRKKEMFLS